MKRCEFLDLHTAQLSEEKPILQKREDRGLPAFATDLPTGSRIGEEGDYFRTEYVWSSVYTNSPFLRIRSIVFRKGEQLEFMVRLRVRDGVDTIALRTGTIVYLLRKTSQDVARALVAIYSRLKGSVEELVGYLQTLAGTVYTISRVQAGAWTFDHQLAEGNDALRYVDTSKLEEPQKQRLCELLQERLLSLHHKNLTLRTFTLYNVLFTPKSLLLTDLRNLRAVRKKTLLVEDFRRVFGYLVTAGIATRADVYQAVITYAVAMEDACKEWYEQEKGEKANDSLALVGALEEALYL